MDKLPDELLIHIFQYAMTYCVSGWDPYHQVLAQHNDLGLDLACADYPTVSARWSICLVNRRWHMVSKPLLYIDIRLWESSPNLSLADRIGSLVSSNESNLAKIRWVTVAEYPSGKDSYLSKKAGAYLCHLLSQVTLQRFATTFCPGYVPWLPLLAHISAHTLTHLVLELNPVHLAIETIEHLNALSNLVWLRILDENDYTFRGPPHPDSVADLPSLELPKLQTLEAGFMSGDGPDQDLAHPEGSFSFWIATWAVTPSLRTLRLYGDPLVSGLDLDMVLDIQGKHIRELHADFPCKVDHVAEILHLAPVLTDLTCVAAYWQNPSGLTLEHRKLQRLTLSSVGKGNLRAALRCIEPERFPELEYIKIAGISWDSLDIEIGPSGQVIWSIDGALEGAIQLAAKGVPVLDEHGRSFKGLISVRRR